LIDVGSVSGIVSHLENIAEVSGSGRVPRNGGRGVSGGPRRNRAGQDHDVILSAHPNRFVSGPVVVGEVEHRRQHEPSVTGVQARGPAPVLGIEIIVGQRLHN
jgi:hypothetical protein